MTISYTGTETFTVAHARRIACKVATDLLRIQRFYREPSNSEIDDYERELVELLKHGVVKTVVYGFKRNGRWTEAAVRYRALPNGFLLSDDDPGMIRPGLDVANANFSSYLTFNATWWTMPSTERSAIESALPFKRVSIDEPSLELGYWHDDKTYSAGGRGLGRSSVRRW